MAIITISRQLGSLGNEIARQLEKQLKLKHLDKETLEEQFEEWGVPDENIRKYDERKPTFWENFSTDKDLYLHFMKKAILDVAAKGECVILGRGGQLLLGDIPGILKIRIIAPMALRIQRVMERFNCDKRHAEKMIRQNDTDRAGFHKFFFNVNWESPDLYDLVVNTGDMPVNTVLAMIKGSLQTAAIKESAKEIRTKVDNLRLGHDVITNIAYTHKIVVHFFEAIASGSKITLRGSTMDKDDIKRCEEIALSVKGVEEVVNEIHYIPVSYGIT